MNTGFLGEDDVAQVRHIMAVHGITDFGAAVRLWGRNKAIQVDGVLTVPQLRCLLDIATFLSSGVEHARDDLRKAA